MAAKLVVAKRVKNAVLYQNGMIRIDNVIASYPHLDKPYAGDDEGAKPKYSTSALLDKKTHKEAILLIKETVRKFMAEKKIKVPEARWFIKDGDAEYPDKEECAGRYVVTARDDRRPTIRDAENNKLTKDDVEEIAEMFYGGCVISLLVNPWHQDNKFGKRINANLNSVKFIEDGEAFGEERIDDDEAWDDDDDGAGSGFDDDDDL